ncbi:MAG TPA: hypothetical protein PKO03_03395 [Anaerolineaceae bacterium]|nr:hypothetical protein [Anaerolineaceae bacterium]
MVNSTFLIYLFILLAIIILMIFLLIWIFRRARRKKAAPGASAPMQTPVEPAAAEPPLAVRAAEIPVVTAADDLKIIEGIGPKIEQILHAAGITTYAALAASDVAHLREILSAANLRIADPATWPMQAKLAAEGQWAELETLQGQLKGGRER